jgi:hypothetical protein
MWTREKSAELAARKGRARDARKQYQKVLSLFAVGISALREVFGVCIMDQSIW